MFCDPGLGLKEWLFVGHLCQKSGVVGIFIFAFGEDIRAVMHTYHECRLLVSVPLICIHPSHADPMTHTSSARSIIFKPCPPPQRHAHVVNVAKK